MYSVGSFGVFPDTFHEAAKTVFTRLFPEGFVIIRMNDMEIFQGLSSFWINDFVIKSCWLVLPVVGFR